MTEIDMTATAAAAFRDNVNLTEPAPLLTTDAVSETRLATRRKSFGLLAGSIVVGPLRVKDFEWSSSQTAYIVTLL
jgi:hypothetical protein